MAVTLDQLKDALFDWADAVTPSITKVVWEDGDDADYSGSRVTFRLVTDKADQTADIVLDSENEQETVTEHTVYTLVVNVWGVGAETLAKRVRASLYSSKRYGFNALWKYVGLGAASVVQNLSSLESAQIEARHEFRVTLNAAISHTFDADYAETVDVTVKERELGIVIDSKVMGADPHPIPEGC